jgi:hypothetical protein
MSVLWRILHVLRRGPRRQRLLAGAGLVLVLGAGGYVVWVLLDLIVAVVVLAVGLYLVMRSLRQSQRSS